MDQLPLVFFAAKHFGDAQVHSNGCCAAVHVHRYVLQPHPIGESVTRRHMKYFELADPAGLELFRAVLIRRNDFVCTFPVATVWAKPLTS
jgi:hypothetical protein